MKLKQATAVLGLVLTLGLAGCGGGEPEPVKEPVDVVMDVTGYGEIEMTLDPEAAPKTVANFVDLVNDGFYDGLTFHRIIDGFMVQGGDPLGNGTGSSEYKVPGEFAENGWDNPISHTRGTVSLARAMEHDSGSCQFFIVHEDSAFLDGQYAAFGQVTSGMDVVDELCENVRTIDNNGTVEAEEQPVIKSIRIVE